MKYDVVICTYNGAKFIEAQILSVLNQTIVPYLIIISDDGSSDETISIISDLFMAHGFSDYIIVMGPKCGIAKNFFNGLSYSTSDVVFLSDQDDIWSVDKAEKYLTAYASYNKSSPILLFSDSILIDNNGEVIGHSFFEVDGLSVSVLEDDSILFKNCVQGATIMLNVHLRDLLMESLRFVNVEKIMIHDWWIAILAKYLGSVHFINERTLSYRQHDNNAIGAFLVRKRKKIMKQIFIKIRNSLRISYQAVEAMQFIMFKSQSYKFNQYHRFGNLGICRKIAAKLLLWFISIIPRG